VLVLVCSVVNAETVLTVHNSDGETVSFPIAEIEFIDFDGLSVKDFDKAGNILNGFRLLSNHPSTTLLSDD